MEKEQRRSRKIFLFLNSGELNSFLGKLNPKEKKIISFAFDNLFFPKKMFIVIENGKHCVEKPGDINSFINLQDFPNCIGCDLVDALLFF